MWTSLKCKSGTRITQYLVEIFPTKNPKCQHICTDYDNTLPLSYWITWIKSWKQSTIMLYLWKCVDFLLSHGATIWTLISMLKSSVITFQSAISFAVLCSLWAGHSWTISASRSFLELVAYNKKPLQVRFDLECDYHMYFIWRNAN